MFQGVINRGNPIKITSVLLAVEAGDSGRLLTLSLDEMGKQIPDQIYRWNLARNQLRLQCIPQISIHHRMHNQPAILGGLLNNLRQPFQAAHPAFDYQLK
jgi:hypothetical protein